MRKTSKRLIKDSIHPGKIYRYNGSNNDFISLHEIYIQKIHEDGRTRTLRSVVHKGVYHTDTIQIPYFITIGKLYRCVKDGKKLMLIPYRAKREVPYSLQKILVYSGYAGLLVFGLLFIFFTNYDFTMASHRREFTIVSMSICIAGAICFSIGKILERREHKLERHLIKEVQILPREMMNTQS